MTRLVTDSIEALRPYQGGKPIEELARERGLTDIIKLASNESALGPSPRAIEAATGALKHVHRYPDGEGYRLRSAIAEFLGVDYSEVLHGNGSNELLELIVRTFMTPDDHIVFGRPSFSMYSVIAGAHNVRSTQVPTSKNLVHDLEGLKAAVRNDTKVILVDNPNNPTGSYVSRKRVEAFLREVPEHIIVVLDEAYFEFADAEDYPDGVSLRHLRDRLIVLRTFAKAYGLAGFRVGYAVGPAQLIGYMNRLRAPFNVGTVSQEAALAGLSDQEHVARVVALNNRERARLSTEMTQMGLHVVPSQTNFILVDFSRNNRELYDQLLDRGVIVRPIPGLDTCLRITIGTEKENDRLLAALREVLS